MFYPRNNFWVDFGQFVVGKIDVLDGGRVAKSTTRDEADVVARDVQSF